MIGKNIRNLRRSLNLTQTEFAKRLFVTPGAVSQWEKEVTRPDMERMLSMCKEFNVPLTYFTAENDELFPDSLPMQKNAVPIVGDIACGTPITAEENVQGFADLPDGIRADFALRCKGESMVPTFRDGDLVLIRQQPDVDDGQIAAVSIDGEATLKHVYHHNGGLLLIADNASFPPISAVPASDRQVIIHGLAIGYTRLF